MMMNFLFRFELGYIVQEFGTEMENKIILT